MGLRYSKTYSRQLSFGFLALAMLFVTCNTQSRASDLRRTAVVKAVQAAAPSVVNIRGKKIIHPAASPSQSRQVNGMGTGVIIDSRGYILTNFHVVDGVRQIHVVMNDGKDVIAKLISHDKKADVAVIKIESKIPLHVIRIGTSKDLMIAEPVIAVGNAYGYENTVSRGIISALHRNVEVSKTQQYFNLIQTDASINPGNSGGPLINIDGEMIGLNTAVRAGAENIGFAIPVDEVLKLAARLMSAEHLNGVWHGLHVNTTGAEGAKTVILSIEPGSPAEKIGLKKGDVIGTIDNHQVSRALDVERAMLGHKVGDKVSFSIRRDGKSKTLQLALASSKVRPRYVSSTNLASKTWDILGLQVTEIPKVEFVKRNTKYHGGLRVTQVRNEGPAAAQGIRRGDILVGMHRWETASTQDLRYIISRADLVSSGPMKFYILRDGEAMTLFGHIRLGQQKGQTRQLK